MKSDLLSRLAQFYHIITIFLVAKNVKAPFWLKRTNLESVLRQQFPVHIKRYMLEFSAMDCRRPCIYSDYNSTIFPCFCIGFGPIPTWRWKKAHWGDVHWFLCRYINTATMFHTIFSVRYDWKIYSLKVNMSYHSCKTLYLHKRFILKRVWVNEQTAETS